MRSLSLATVFAAASGFVVIWLASYIVDASQYAEFQAYWGLFFALTGAIDGLMQETTRAIADARETGRHRPGSPWQVGLWVALGAATLGAVISATVMGELVSWPTGTAGALLIAGLASYAFQAVLSGVLSGLKLWRRYAGLVALDSGVRLLATVVAWVCGAGIVSLLVITVCGAASWLVILGLDPDARGSFRVPVDVTSSALTRRAATAMLATGASAALVTGFPVFVKAAFDDAAQSAGAVTVGGVILAVTLTRAPILVPLQRFQSALIVRFVSTRDTLFRAAALPAGVTLGAGAVGAAAAWLIGPAIMRVFFPSDLFVPGPTLAALTFASAFTGALMITGAATLAIKRHGCYVAGWVVASLVAFGTLFIPAELVESVVVALILGPAAGIGVHVYGIGRHRAGIGR